MRAVGRIGTDGEAFLWDEVLRRVSNGEELLGNASFQIARELW